MMDVVFNGGLEGKVASKLVTQTKKTKRKVKWSHLHMYHSIGRLEKYISFSPKQPQPGKPRGGWNINTNNHHKHIDHTHLPVLFSLVLFSCVLWCHRCVQNSRRLQENLHLGLWLLYQTLQHRPTCTCTYTDTYTTTPYVIMAQETVISLSKHHLEGVGMDGASME